METDLGEYIIQLAHQRPYHIVAPALHMTRYEVADLFTKKLGVERETVVEKQTMIARADPAREVSGGGHRHHRRELRGGGIGRGGRGGERGQRAADVVGAQDPHRHRGDREADSARAGSGRVSETAGAQRDGQPLTVYTSFLSGPRRGDEIDGPEEFYLVLLDNGRTKLLADRDKRESLYCIRCGACLNHCPVYRKIGGHNYPWVYSGPIGAIITPQFAGIQQDPWLPFASSLCGACAEVCPVKIDIPRILLELRSEVIEGKTREGSNRWERLAFRVWAWLMRRPRLYQAVAMMAAGVAPAVNRTRRTAMDPRAAGLHECRPDEGVDQCARPAAGAGAELPGDVAGASGNGEILMARDQVLHKVRTALGRSAGQAPEPAPPVDLRVPVMDMERRIAEFRREAGIAGGQDGLRADRRRGRRVRARRDRRAGRGGFECAVPGRVRDHAPGGRAVRHSRIERRCARRARPLR